MPFPSFMFCKIFNELIEEWIFDVFWKSFFGLPLVLDHSQAGHEMNYKSSNSCIQVFGKMVFREASSSVTGLDDISPHSQAPCTRF